MQQKLIERGWAGLDTMPVDTCKVAALSGADDPQWAGIVDIAPMRRYVLDAGWRHDVYVVRGEVELNSAAQHDAGAPGEIEGHLLCADDFVGGCGAATLCTNKTGVRLFVYREASVGRSKPRVCPVRQRVWLDGRNPRMRVVPLSTLGHRVSLVAWQPGARTASHTHRDGEELFVLSGELLDADMRYPAGSWVRLYPGARHEPFADAPAVILLRHGHLHPASLHPASRVQTYRKSGEQSGCKAEAEERAGHLSGVMHRWSEP